MFEFGSFMNRFFLFVCFCLKVFFVSFFVYFAQEERNQMLRIRSQLVDMVLTREMQYYLYVSEKKLFLRVMLCITSG